MMRSLSGLGISLTLVFGCLFFALLAEIYYLLCWKKRVAHCDRDDDRTSPARELAHLFCWRKPSSLTSAALTPRGIGTSSSRAAGGGGAAADGSRPKQRGGEEDSIEVELMRLHNLCGPPRLLYTIKEETKEDMESEDEKSAGGGGGPRDVVLTMDGGGGAATPFETPLSSPQFFSPHASPLIQCYGQRGFNPLFESCKDDDTTAAHWIRASPPPKFKFLRDAEEKLYRKTLMTEEVLKVQRNAVDEEELSGGEETRFVTIDMGKNQEKSGRPINPSQVIPISVQ